MDQKPFFSVIIPTYNRKETVEMAVESVLNQTFGGWELIVIDDGSTDGTAKALKKIKDRRLRVVSQSNHGVSHARNRGISLAQADWVCFLDSDDRWEPQKLERVREAIGGNPEIRLFHTEEIWTCGGKEVYQPQRYCRPTGRAYRDVVMIGSIDASSAAVHKDVFDAVGYFDEGLAAGEDYDFWLRATHAFEVKLIPEALTVKDLGREDRLSESPAAVRGQIEALVKMLGTVPLEVKDYDATADELAFRSEMFLEDALKNDRLTRIWQHQDMLNGLVD